MNVLLAEDEKHSQQIRRGLNAEAYVVDIVHDGETAADVLLEGRHDIAIINADLPYRSGLEVCRYVRKRGSQTLILMITNEDRVAVRVDALGAGADDCLTWPFAFEELSARVRALLRRRQASGEKEALQIGDISLDLLTRQVQRSDGVLVDLTTREFMLLETFLRHPRHVLTRSQLLAQVWGLDYLGASNVVDVYVRYLRNKLDDNDGRLLQTVRGAGYRFAAAPVDHAQSGDDARVA